MNILAALLIIFTMCVSPGPNNIMLMSSGLNHGIRRTLPHYFGVCFGFAAMFLIAGLGLTTIFMAYPSIATGMRIVGAIFLVYMAWRIAFSHAKLSVKQAKPITFFHAVFFQWINPKGWACVLAVITAYISKSEHLLHDNLELSGWVLLINFFCGSIWLFAGSFLRRLLNNDFRKRIFNYTMGLLLASCVILMFIE